MGPNEALVIVLAIVGVIFALAVAIAIVGLFVWMNKRKPPP